MDQAVDLVCPQEGSSILDRWHIRKQPVPEQAAAANSQPVTIPRSLEKDGLKFEVEGWLVHHSILFTEQTAKWRNPLWWTI